MMKKICLLVLIMVLGKLSFSQGYPVTQYIGTDSAVVISRGAMQSRLVNYVYTDTTQANTQRIKAYPGAQIVTTNGGTNFILWIRNQNATRWLQIPAGSGVGNIYTVDGTLTGNRTLLGANNSLTFNQISSLLFRADTTTVTNDGVATLNVKGAIGRVLVVDTTAPVDERIYEIKSNNGEFFISKINDAQTLQDSTFYISSGGNIGINTFSPGARLGVNGNTFVKGQLFAGDTALSTYQVEGILTTPYVLGRKAVDTTLSTQARPTGVQGHVVGRGPIANRLQGGTFYATTDSSSTANSTGSLRATTSWTAHNGSGTLANAWGSYNIVSNKTTGTITNAYGSVSGVENRGATSTINKLQGSTTEVWNNYGGTIDTAWGQVISIYNNNASSNIGAVYGLSIGRGLITPTGGTHFWRNAGTIGSSYGIYLDSAIDVGTNRFALYSNSYSDSYLKGNLGLGTTTPGGRLAIVDTGGFALKINYNSASTVADSNAAIYAENNGTSSYVAILNEKTTNNTGGQYPLLVQSSLLSGTAQAGMATGIHFATPDAQGNKKVTQLAFRTTTADSATYTNRAELRLWNNGSLSTPYYLLGNGNMGLGTSTPDSNLTVVNGALFQRGVRMSGLPQTPGTKALRIDASGTISYADTLVDAGGTVTSVATNNGTGITGGTITTTGTLAIDTLLISTRAWRQKGIDSVAALANTKINGSLISGYLTKATGTNTIDTSQIYQSSGLIGIGTTSPTLKLDVNGDILINGLRAGRGLGNINTNAVLGRLAFNANTTGFQNVAVGNLTLYSNTTGSNNVAIGNSALSANTTANHNVAIGHNSMLNNTTGFQNVAVGIQSLNANTTGENNTAIGTGALGSITTGYYNAAIGLASGRYITSGANNTTSNESVYLGYDTRASANGNTNEIVIGGSAQGNGSNSVTLGNASITKTVLRENVGIGTVTPDSALTVVNGAYFQRGVRMSGLPTGVGTKAVRINANGTLSVADTLANGISGTGTTNYIPKFTSSSAIGNSSMYDNSGNIGINTISAAAKLHIYGAFPELRLEGNNDVSGSGFISFYRPTSGIDGYIQSGGSGLSIDATTNLLFRTGGSERMRLTSGGSLGIGTSSPTSPLTVYALNNTAAIRVTNGPSANNAGITLESLAGNVVLNNGNGPLEVSTGGSLRMTLSTSGNLGLGVTPSAWDINFKAIESPAGSIYDFQTTAKGFSQNAYFSSSGWLYKTTNTASLFVQINGEHRWYNAPSGTAGNAISFTQAMTLDASGRLGIGTTSPDTRTNIVKNALTKSWSADADDILAIENNGTTLVDIRSSNAAAGYVSFSDGDARARGLITYSHASDDMRFNTAGSERMRITSGGNVGIGTTSPDSALTVQTGAWVKRGLRLSGLPTGIGTKELRIDANGVVYANDTLSNDISGSGTTNYIPKFTSSSAIGNSSVTDNGTLVQISNTSFPELRLKRTNSTTNSGLISFVGSDDALKWNIGTNFNVGGAGLEFNYGYTNYLFLTSGGSLGIGTSAPSGLFEVKGDGVSYFTRGTKSILLNPNVVGANTNALIETSTGMALAFGTNGSERMRLDASGNLIVGGTSASNRKFSVIGTPEATSGILAGFQGVSTGALKLHITDGTSWNWTIGGNSTGNFVFTSGEYPGNAGTTRMTLDASGNLGLGVTPSAWTTYKAVQVANASLWGAVNNTYVGANNYYDGTNRRYISTGFASEYGQVNGEHRWLTAVNAAAGGIVSFTQAMTLDASGNLNIGTTGGSRKLNVYSTTSGTYATYISQQASTSNSYGLLVDAGTNSSDATMRIRSKGGTDYFYIRGDGNVGIGTTSPNNRLSIFSGTGTSSFISSAANNNVEGTSDVVIGQNSDDGGYFWNRKSSFLSLGTANTERMRITSGGNVGIGTSSPQAFSGITGLSINGNTGALFLMNNGTHVFSLYNDNSNTLLASVSNTGLVFGTNNAERMRISAAGELLINTTSDAGDYKLQVNGQTYFGTASTSNISTSFSTNVAGLQINGGAGSSTVANSAYIRIGDTNNAKYWLQQINDNGDLDFWYYDGASWSKKQKFNNNGSILTTAPSGGTAKPFKIGAAAVVSPTSPNRTIEIEIDGVTYYLSAKTTND